MFTLVLWDISISTFTFHWIHDQIHLQNKVVRKSWLTVVLFTEYYFISLSSHIIFSYICCSNVTVFLDFSNFDDYFGEYNDIDIQNYENKLW